MTAPTKKKLGRPRKQVPKSPPFATGGANSISQRIASVLGAKESPVDIEEIALAFYDGVGGAKGYAERILAAYNMTRVGSAEQARLLDLMNDLFKIASARRGTVDLDQVTDAELESEALRLGKLSGLAGLPIQDWIDHVCI